MIRVWEIGVLPVRELSNQNPEQHCTASGSSRVRAGIGAKDQGWYPKHKAKVQ